jgi:hypothetical protein
VILNIVIGIGALLVVLICLLVAQHSVGSRAVTPPDQQPSVTAILDQDKHQPFVQDNDQPHLHDDPPPPFNPPLLDEGAWMPPRPYTTNGVSVASRLLLLNSGAAYDNELPVVKPDQCAVVTNKDCANSDPAADQPDQPHLHGENGPPTNNAQLAAKLGDMVGSFTGTVQDAS